MSKIYFLTSITAKFFNEWRIKKAWIPDVNNIQDIIEKLFENKQSFPLTLGKYIHHILDLS